MALPANLATNDVIDEVWVDAVTNTLASLGLVGAGPPVAAGAAGDRYFDTVNKRDYTHDGTAWVRTGWTTAAGRTYYESNAAIGSIANNTVVPLTWSAEVSDTDGFGNLGTTITVPAGLGGLYIVSMTVTMAGNPGTSALARLLFNIGGVGRTVDGAMAALGQIGSPCAMYPMAPGDTVVGQVFQNSGAALNITSANIRLARVGP